ncbi:MAG: hypothetical protein R3257_03105, partial [bacterium]|nr:hypothetical protein [bacterium]
ASSDPWAWFAPLFEGNLTWPDVMQNNPQLVCEMIKDAVDNDPERMLHHLMEDPRVIWSVISGRTPGVDQEPAPPYDPDGPGDDGQRAAAAYEEWDSLVHAWVEGGMNCEPSASFGTNAIHAPSLPNPPPGTDSLPPTTTANWMSGYYNDPKTIILICDDGAGSGCDKTYYRLGSGNCAQLASQANPFNEYSGPFTVEEEGEQCLQFYSRDKASNNDALLSVVNNNISFSADRVANFQPLNVSGNKEDPIRFADYFMDFTQPVTAASLMPTADPNLVKVQLTCSDPDGSGCWVTRYRVDGQFSDPILATYQEPIVIDRSQAHTVYFFSQDRALNPGARESIVVPSLEEGGVDLPVVAVEGEGAGAEAGAEGSGETAGQEREVAARDAEMEPREDFGELGEGTEGPGAGGGGCQLRR